MSRTAVFAALSDVLPDVDIYQSDAPDTPDRGHPFIVLRWQEDVLKMKHRGPRILDVWIHIPNNLSLDHADIDPILKSVINALVPLEHVEGDDGYTITSVRFTGAGRDATDPAYGTIVRNAAFEVLAHS